MTRRNVRSRRALASAIAALTATALLAGAWLVSPAAAEDEITVTPERVIFGEPGSTMNVTTEAVPAELVGKTCSLRIVAENGSSIHPGNTLIVTTAGNQIVVPGVEDNADGSVVAAQEVVIGDSITFDLQLGEEGVSSLGFSAGFDCIPDVAEVVEEPTEPTVLPAQQEPEPTVAPAQQLPETPVASSHHGQPDYTG